MIKISKLKVNPTIMKIENIFFSATLFSRQGSFIKNKQTDTSKARKLVNLTLKKD